MRNLLFAATLLPSFVLGTHLITWAQEKNVEHVIKKLERDGCLVYSVHCQNPEDSIAERKWIIEYETNEWEEEK